VEKMTFFKRVPCENYQEINTEILAYLNKHNLIDTATVFWNPISLTELFYATPLFLNWTRQNNLKLHSIALTVARRTDALKIHCDTPPARYKLSWPILNTKNTFNRWYSYKVLTPTTEINQLGGTMYSNPNELEEIERMEVIQPSIIDAGIPHDIMFESPIVFPRVGFQCQLFNEPNSL
jgi:hypothetical protein